MPAEPQETFSNLWSVQETRTCRGSDLFVVRRTRESAVLTKSNWCLAKPFSTCSENDRLHVSVTKVGKEIERNRPPNASQPGVKSPRRKGVTTMLKLALFALLTLAITNGAL